MVSLLAIATSIVLGLLAWGFGWLGPSAPAVVLFAAFGACGLSRSNKISRGFLLTAASVCAVFAAFCLETMRLQSTYGLSPWWQEETLLAVLGAVAATLLAGPWRNRTHSR
jgi:glucose uptake protein GlcU